MHKNIRLFGLVVTLTVITSLSLAGAVWAVPGSQGTVPPCPGKTEASLPLSSPELTVTLDTCTGQVIIPSQSVPGTGRAQIKEETLADLKAIGPLPTGLNFLSNGLTLSIFNSDGKLVKFFNKSVQVCFPFNPQSRGVIRMWDPKFNRWIPFPTRQVGELICTRTRLPGTYAPVGR